MILSTPPSHSYSKVGSDAAQITLLAVRKRFRRMGIGRYLMQVHSHGCAAVHVHECALYMTGMYSHVYNPGVYVHVCTVHVGIC